jgi:hypothetical protein
MIVMATELVIQGGRSAVLKVSGRDSCLGHADVVS